jgi:succinate dehydrogenase/fumarate reductase cytochrome b subunit
VNHPSDDDLVLHYYGEDDRDNTAVEQHVATCAQCARAYEAISRSLNAVTAPEFVDIPELEALRQMIGRGASAQRSRLGAPAAVVWMAALLYPVSLQALFGSGRFAHDHAVGIPLVALTLLWACAGPLLAVRALNRVSDSRFESRSARLLVLGALLAAIGPSLFLVVSRVDVSLSLNLGLWSWYGVIALASLATLLPWPTANRPTPRLVSVHRLSALVLTVFVLAHVVNQALAFASVPAYAAMRSIMRLLSQQPVTYAVMVASVAVQIVSGVGMGMQRVRAGAVARNLQAVSGWCLAAFLLVHVFSGLLIRQPQAATAVAPTAVQFNLLATPRAAATLPFLLLGVTAFLFHVGVYARLAAVAYLAETSVRRLSYAGIVVATTLVVTVGLSLCGIHLK